MTITTATRVLTPTEIAHWLVEEGQGVPHYVEEVEDDPDTVLLVVEGADVWVAYPLTRDELEATFRAIRALLEEDGADDFREMMGGFQGGGGGYGGEM